MPEKINSESAAPLETMLDITLATTNENKVREMSAYVEARGLPVRIHLPPVMLEVEETGATFAENARLKAEAYAEVVRTPWILAEDSGFVVPALSGLYGIDPFPGVRSNRWMTPEIRRELLETEESQAEPVTHAEKNRGILKLMAGKANREAFYACAMALYSPVEENLFDIRGGASLWITEDGPRGDGGFGYDPIVFPLSEAGVLGSRTMAELSLAEKNAISHRGRALEQLCYLIENL